jgi:DNA-directed RNA polymerase subunit beta'
LPPVNDDGFSAARYIAAIDIFMPKAINYQYNTQLRIKLMVDAIQALSARFGEDLILVVGPAGTFGFEGKVPATITGTMEQTTVGRVLFYSIVPSEVPFDLVNRALGKKQLGDLIDKSYRLAGPKKTVIFADQMLALGFEQSTKAGISICINDMQIPASKKKYLDEAEQKVTELQESYESGMLTFKEKYNQVVDLWTRVTEQVSKELIQDISTESVLVDGEEQTQASFNSIYMMIDSGARGSKTQIRQLAGMRGLMSKPNGEIIETPITANFREGLTVHQYFISTHGARKGLADTALKTANSGYLTRRLVDVVQDFVVIKHDCDTVDGLEVTALNDGGKIIEDIGARVLGRVTAEDIQDPNSDEVLVPRNVLVDEEIADKILSAGVQKVKIRSVMACSEQHGVCAMCYGRDLARGRLVNVGEAVGVIAAQSIGEPGTQLTMRTFHIGGAAQGGGQKSSQEVNNSGVVHFSSDLQDALVVDRDGRVLTTNRNGEIYLLDERGRERERYPIDVGAYLQVSDGEKVASKKIIARWDPMNRPIIVRQRGELVIHGHADGVEITKNESTGLARVKVKKDSKHKIMIEIKLGDKTSHKYNLPAETQIDPNGFLQMRPEDFKKYFELSEEARTAMGFETLEGDIVAKIPQEIQVKNRDITGGLPRVANLFEARKPKRAAVLATVSGYVRLGKETRRNRVVEIYPMLEACFVDEKEIGSLSGRYVEVISPNGAALRPGQVISLDAFEKANAEAVSLGGIMATGKAWNSEPLQKVAIPKARTISVQNGDQVREGMILIDGDVDPHDILAVRGQVALAEYLLNEIQEVYRLQGVKINDKHIEVIVRRMLRKVKIVDPGDSQFFFGKNVERYDYEVENTRIRNENLKIEEDNRQRVASGEEPLPKLREVKAEHVFLGISKAALSTDSFLSAASFQETTKVLTEAALQNKVDHLRGLKENILLGRLIPAGTGFQRYKGIESGTSDDEN